MFFFFFFKQKTAYEMRISDWSSDVCSSDLTIQFLTECAGDTATNTITKTGNDIADTVITPRLRDRFQEEIVRLAASKVRVEIVRSGGKYGSPQYQEIGRASCRERVCQYV